MNKLKFDVVVPLTLVDVPTFKENYYYILKYLPCKRIVILGNTNIKREVSNLESVVFVNEDELYPDLSFDKVRKIKKVLSGSERRTGWYFQQFLKMAYSYICAEDYYLIWDADTIPIKKIDLFSNTGIPFLDYRQYEKSDECYNETQNSLLADETLKKSVQKSFITEHMLINVEIMKNLINDLASSGTADKKSFWINILYSIPQKQINLSGFSEFECYAAYVLKYYPQKYCLRLWKNLRNARTYVGSDKTKCSLSWFRPLFDVVSYEDFDSQWFICKLLCVIDQKHRIPFTYIYRLINPLYRKYLKARLFIRKVLINK